MIRRTASEVIRSLEVRIARLEDRTAGIEEMQRPMPVSSLERELRSEGIILPELGVSTAEVKKHTLEMAKELAENTAHTVYETSGGFKISGLRLVKLGSYTALATSTDRLFCDLGLFQIFFKKFFAESDYFEQNNYGLSESGYGNFIDPKNVSGRLLFVLDGNTFTIKLAR